MKTKSNMNLLTQSEAEIDRLIRETMHSDESDLSQDLHKVFRAFFDLRPDEREVTFKMRGQRIRTLGDRTLIEVIRAGEADKALRYLQSISSGQNG